MSDPELRERVPTIDESIQGLKELLAIWQTDANSVEIPLIEGSPLTGVAINILAQHTVALTRSIILLTESRMHLQSVPLIRLSIECGMTAAWLSVAPNAGKASHHASEWNRYGILKDLFQDPSIRDEEILSEVEKSLEGLAGYRSSSAQIIKNRFHQIAGGDKMYIAFRILSGYSHAGIPLIDPYLDDVPRDETNIYGVSLLNEPNYPEINVALGYQVAMLCLTLTAWDNISKEESQASELEAIAVRFGIGRKIELIKNY